MSLPGSTLEAMTSNDAGATAKAILPTSTAFVISQAWMRMQPPNFTANRAVPDLSALIPDISKAFGGPSFDELTKRMASVAATSLPKPYWTDIHKMIQMTTGIEAVGQQHAQMMRQLLPSIKVASAFTYGETIQGSFSRITESITSTVDPAVIANILSNARAFRDEVIEQDVDALTEEFFDSHPDLAESIEEIASLYTLSRADRMLVIWFVRISVTLSVACFMLNISDEYPDLQRILDALGLGGGYAAGKLAGDVTAKALDKLPHEETG